MITLLEGKNYLAEGIDYYIAFNTRRKRDVLSQDVVNDILTSNKLYCEKNQIVISDIMILNEHSLSMKIVVPPEVAIANAVYNIRRNSSSYILKNDLDVKRGMQGEKALWTRKYVVSDSQSRVNELLGALNE